MTNSAGSLNETFIVLISTTMAFAGCVADVLLLYEPNAKYEDGDYLFLLGISQDRLLAGSFLGVATIPIYLSGIYVVINKYIQNKFAALISFICCVYIAVIGCVYHASIPMVGYILKASDSPLTEIEEIRIYFDVYAVVLAISFFTVCIVFGYLMYLKKEWTLLSVNPIITYCACILSYIAVPSVGRILLPIGFNLSIAILMNVMYFKLHNEIEEKSKYS